MLGKKFAQEIKQNLADPAKQLGLIMTAMAASFIIIAVAILIMAVK